MFVLSAYEDLLPENKNNPEGYTTVGNYYSAYETYFDPHGPGDDTGALNCSRAKRKISQ